jgi:hypothetical protein
MHYATVRVLDAHGAALQTYEPTDDLSETKAIGETDRPDDVHSHADDAGIRLYDAAGNVIETHEREGDFKEA